MWILIRILFALAGRYVSQFLFKKNLNTEVITTPDGLSYRHKTSKDKNGQIISQLIEFDVTGKSYVHFRNENFFSRFLKSTGFASELQTGNKEFDDSIFVACDDTEAIRYFQEHKLAQDAVLKIWQQGWHDILTDGRSGKIRLKGKSKAPLTKEVLDHLLILQLYFNKMPHNPWFQDHFSLKIVAFETFAYSILGYSLASYLELVVSDTIGLISPWGLVVRGFMLGLGLVFVWLIAALILLKGSSRLVILVTDFLFISLVCVFISGPQLMTDLNVALDRSEVQMTKAYLLDKYSKTTGSGKSRRTNFYFKLGLRENPFHLPQTFKVAPWTHWRFEKGQTVDFFIYKGFFNSAYVDSIELSATPFDLSTLQNSTSAALPTNLKSESEIISALRWIKLNQSVNDQDLKNVKWIEQEYSRGKLKSKEPTINGLKEGLARYWHPNGVLYAEIPWKNDLKDGRFQLYREDGRIESDFTYKQGKPHGVMRWFDQNGKMSHNLIYVDGEVQSLSSVKTTELIKANWD